ncbi:MAG TPA: adenylate/guanylate cyclase domain-containing protein [Anaerolineaceae bacterium]|nr:adenylate/guanylate cyclase domain-containing protein [Anaerolineaceae bacterium]
MVTESGSFSAIEGQFLQLTGQVEQLQAYLQQNRNLQLPPFVTNGITQLAGMVPQLRRTLATLEEERKSLRAYIKIGAVINSSLELEMVLQIVMDTLIRLTGAERGFMMLRDNEGELVIRIARNWVQESLDQSEFAVSSTVINRVVKSGQPVLTTNAQEDPRFTGQQSIVAYNLRSILCVPLKIKDDLLGVIYADNRIRTGLFTQRDLELIAAFANQAAFAVENARLFDSVRRTLAEVTELKDLMDNVFASIASGVVTADMKEHVLLCNRAAENILGRASAELVGLGLAESVPMFAPNMEPYLRSVLQTNQPVLGVEVSPKVAGRGRMDLRFSFSPLRDSENITHGVAIVMDDLTERKKLEAQRRLFERMVSPAVIDQLDPDSLKLGGRKATITTLFADIRGFTSFSETVTPEELVAVLNRFLATAADAVLDEEGTVDKFLGDAVMAWFNAPIPQPDHTLRAVRAALAIRRALPGLSAGLPVGVNLSFGVGIHVGDAVLGLVGTEKRLEYTAIGDSVNTAKRIQENALGGQILISEPAYRMVAEYILAAPVDPIQAKGKREPVKVYEVIDIK